MILYKVWEPSLSRTRNVPSHKLSLAPLQDTPPCYIWVPNIDTNWFLRRNKQSELAGKIISWTHRRTMEPLSQVKSYFTINTSNKCQDSKSLMGLLEAAKCFKPWAILKTSSADCFAHCLAGVIPKKEAGNTQTRYDYKKPPMLCFAVLSVYACTCGYVDIEIV